MNRALVTAEFEQFLREHDGPIRCCDYWPECSHMLAWMEAHPPEFFTAPSEAGESHRSETES